MIDKFKKWYRQIPDKKRWVDMITALLTVPVLITVIFSNLGNLKKNEQKDESTITSNPTVERLIIKESSSPQPTGGNVNIQPTPTQKAAPSPSCIDEVPSYEIVFPREGDKVSVDPVCLSLRQVDKGDYCSTVWAYRVNDSSLSTYNNDPICLYNMASGPVKAEVRIKSTVTGNEETLVRNFIYQNTNDSALSLPTPSITPSESS